MADPCGPEGREFVVRAESRQRTEPPRSVDAVVIGGGHAGIEAVWALARRGNRTALVTFDESALARMSCNPSVGGLAKGQLVREIDALGGLMGRLIDRTGIHFRMLNRGKGPAVHAPRAQADKPAYTAEALRRLAILPALEIVAGEVTELCCESAPGERRRVAGVRLRTPRGEAVEIGARVVILATGTFLGGRLFTGLESRPGGRREEPSATALAESLRALGLRLGRLKTGTPPRLRRDSIDFAPLSPQPGDEPPPRFSFFETEPVRNRVICHLTRTNARTHEIIRGALDRSPLYGGLIHGIGPRYCPSIEDKVVRFPERASHQIFLEPEGLEACEIYPNGVSTSLPEEAQLAFLRSIPGLGAVEIAHPGYAVEYDFLHTSQIDHALRVRSVEGLYAAGQINGTSGYEEAAAQGLMAGLQAGARLAGRPPLRLDRSEAYIAVLIDDLVTKAPSEPYRMFTSQSEYRLLLRHDNADQRLSARGAQWGLLGDEELRRVEERWGRVTAERTRLRATRLTREARARWEASRDGRESLPAVSDEDVGRNYEDLLRRPGVDLGWLARLGHTPQLESSDWVTVEADIKYEGYVERLRREIAHRHAWEATAMPDALLDDPPAALSREARECLRLRRPGTVGQASRIPGVTPCDISVILIALRKGGRTGPGREEKTE